MFLSFNPIKTMYQGKKVGVEKSIMFLDSWQVSPVLSSDRRGTKMKKAKE
jgi:hypothetical protein